MTGKIRRVVTGHDQDGKAVITIDDLSPHVMTPRKGATATGIWSTETLPADNGTMEDAGGLSLGTSIEDGSIFRIVDYEPGVSPRNHRSQSIDYGVVMSGEIHMQLDGGTVDLKEGDVLVQRGTIHNWENRGSKPCRMAFILIGAKPLKIGNKELGDVG
jgi:quercetin dioxygenase-like cupin family protein